MPRERTRRTEAIILRRTDFAEADRLLTLYTREFGKLKAIAKGARKPQSRKTGHVELFMRTNFLLASGRDLDIVTQAEMVDAYPELRADLVRTTYASYAVELLDRFTAEDDKNISLYDLVGRALGWFAGSNNLLLAARYYELRLLGIVGYQPQLFRCVVCGGEIEEEDQYFSAELGGLIHPDERTADGRAKPISASAVKVLRYLQSRSWETVNQLQLRRDLHSELEGILFHYITHILERQLKSVDFLRHLRQDVVRFQRSDDA